MTNEPEQASLAMEHAVLGAVITDGTHAAAICARHGVSTSWFTAPRTELWRYLMDECFAVGKVIDSTTVMRIRDERKIGDTLLVERCMDACVTVAHLEYYIEVLRGQALLRESRIRISADAKLIESATAETIQHDMLALARGWTEACGSRVESKSIVEVGEALVKKWETPAAPGEIQWPLSSLQKHLGSLEDDLVFVCAQQSVGKTAFAVQWSVCLGHAGISVAYNSLESSIGRIVTRMIAQIGHVDTWKLRNREALPNQYTIAHMAVKTAGKLPLRINDMPMTIDQVRAWGILEKARGSKMLVIDNMKHIQAGRKFGSTVEEFRYLSSSLKWLRDEVRLPVVVLHHLTDDGDVSWSKDIKRDADLLIYMTDDMENSTPASRENNWSGDSVVNFTVRKNRDGKKEMTIPLRFHKDVQTFVEVEGRDA